MNAPGAPASLPARSPRQPHAGKDARAPSSSASCRSAFGALILLTLHAVVASESPYLYGIHDHSPVPTEYLQHITNATGTGGWITATVAVGANTNDQSGTDFTALAAAGHTVICRINYGYYPDGTIPVPAKYDDFAVRCRNFVAHSPGCSLWLIGNEVNLSAEWPFDSASSRFTYLSPQSYATCFRKVSDAIKAVRPTDKVLPQACAPWAGPYGAGTQNINGTNYPADGQPITWVRYENQMLSAITNTGTLDGIALHIGSRGYHNADIFSTNKFGGLNLYSSFYVYKDWVDYGIPSALYALPLYVTECNGLYYWKGGGPPGEDPSQHYEPGWMQAIYAEINSYNQTAATTGKPIFHCFNMYRWCGFCDGWNVDGASDGYKDQILSDLDAAAAQRYAWPTNVAPTNPPAAPAGLTASVGNARVTLAWTAAPLATSYNVMRSTVSGGPYSTIASNVPVTVYLNTSFTPGVTYYYVVSAVNSVGESTNSSPASATPTNGLPDVVVTAVNWTPPGTLFAPTNVVFQATVKNQGSAATPGGTTLGVGFLVDGVQFSWAGGYSSALAAGASVTLTADGGPSGVNFWTATTGVHTVTANADDIDRFPESNEDNNTLDRALAVYPRAAAMPPVSGPLADKTVNAGSRLTFVALAADPQPGLTLADFEGYAAGSTSVMFRDPAFSSTTSGWLDGAPNVAAVTSTFPPGHSGSRALRVNWSFAAGGINPWLRLSTFAATSLPNPILDFSQSLRFDIYADRELKVGLGLRETNPAGVLGGDGGTTGAIEFVGAVGLTGATPNLLRVIPASNWVTLTFNFTNEPVAAFTGNGVLETTTGKGVLEHLAFAPGTGGAGAYNVFLDNFAFVPSSTLRFALSNSPPGAAINATNGAFTWTPTEAQAPGPYTMTVRLTKNGSANLADAKAFTVGVVPSPRFSAITPTNGAVMLTWQAYPGKIYRVQYKHTLDATTWSNLVPDVTAGGVTASTLDASGTGQRFYRVLLVD